MDKPNESLFFKNKAGWGKKTLSYSLLMKKEWSNGNGWNNGVELAQPGF